MILQKNEKGFEMVLVSDFSNDECVSKSTIYSLSSKGGALNTHRFAKIGGRLYVTCDDYKHPFRDEITSLTYRALEIYGTEYAMIKRIGYITGLSFSTIKGLLYRNAFKDPVKANLIINALKRIGQEGLF